MDHLALSRPLLVSAQELSQQSATLSRTAGGLPRITPCKSTERLKTNHVETACVTKAASKLGAWTSIGRSPSGSCSSWKSHGRIASCSRGVTRFLTHPSGTLTALVRSGLPSPGESARSAGLACLSRRPGEDARPSLTAATRSIPKASVPDPFFLFTRRWAHLNLGQRTVGLRAEYRRPIGFFKSIEPGMAVTAEIKTGQRRIIEYLLSLVLRCSHDAGRGRCFRQVNI